MSSLKAIMDDVDVEPLSSQNYKHSIQAPNPSIAPSSSASQASHETTGKTPIKRRRSNRVQSTATGSDTTARYRDAGAESMDFPTVYQSGPSNRPNPSRVPESTGRSEGTAEVPVKYTPVTGRISRAKKGVPVHTCDICRPVKTFTRAEHLRRHQLSHQKPAYPCTFEDCERAFHRPDLLARHIHRHETQGEKPYRTGDPRSRASSSTSESRTPSLKVEGTTQGAASNTEQMFPDPTIPPRTSGSAELSKNVSSVSKSGKDFSASNVANSVITSPGLGSSRAHSNYRTMNDQHGYGPTQPAFDEPFMERSSSQFAADGTTPQLPLLRIPEEVWVPGLSYNSSPWCSSASDTQSDASKNGSQWAFRGRSASVATLADWPTWMPHANQQEIQSLDLPAFGGLLMQSVGPPALPAYDRSLAQNSPAPPPTRALNSRLECGMVKADLLEPVLPHYPETHSYLASYWLFFHPVLPIIHKPTFDTRKNHLLSAAMAAIGTQYHDSIEARKKGSELNDQCRKELDKNMLLSLSDLGTLQAILLTEIFTRFRGRKIIVQPSRWFNLMYGKVLEHSSELVDEPDVSTIDSHLNQNNRFAEGRLSSNCVQLEWRKWIEREARRRLLSACFMFDIHQSICFQQPVSRMFADVARHQIYLPSPDTSWEACSSSQWKAQTPTITLHLLHADIARDIETSLYTQSLLICYNLPIRDDTADWNSFPTQNLNSWLKKFKTGSSDTLLVNSYLALYYTPLLDLLAVAGDTWVFSRKITPPSVFDASQSRLKSWSSSLAAAHATYHACRVLSNVLPVHLNPISGGVGNSAFGLSDYWSMYVSALILWAFSHRLARKDYLSENGTADHGSGNASEEARVKALECIKVMLSLGVENLLTSKATIKSDTISVVDAVRQRLEIIGVGNKSGLIVDAVVVLGRIRDAGKGKLF